MHIYIIQFIICMLGGLNFFCVETKHSWLLQKIKEWLKVSPLISDPSHLICSIISLFPLFST